MKDENIDVGDLDLEKYLDTLRVVIADKRKTMSISQSTLSDATGLSRWYISDIERGTRSISIKNLAKLSYGLRVPLSNILIEVEQRLGSQYQLLSSSERCDDQCFLIVERTASGKATIVSFDEYFEQHLGSACESYIGIDLVQFLKEALSPESVVDLEEMISVVNGKPVSLEVTGKSSSPEIIRVKPLLRLSEHESLLVVLMQRKAVREMQFDSASRR
ncbi:MAG: helix-turn-helix transcriptional regulator [Cyanobacteria bacterium HKST-UBA01]|nr:helix-turn-helix transcriptional regulator [Cyanobacteria bacterium HKST-UBA01]